MPISARTSGADAAFDPTTDDLQAPAGEPPEALATEPATTRWATVLSALYPLLLAVFPPLSVATTSIGGYRPQTLLIVVGAAVAVGALTLVACTAVVRLIGRDEPLARGALLAGLCVAWFFYYLPLQAALVELLGSFRLLRAVYLIPILLVPSAAVAWLALRRRWTLGGLGKFVTVAGALLVGMSAARVVQSHNATRARVLGSAMWRRVSGPVPTRPGFVAGPKRDVYLLILDGYPNAEVLRARFGLDVAPFVDSLRALGFTIPRRMRSNYTQTILSIPSLLNFEHVTPLARDLRPDDRDQTLPNHLVQHNRTTRFLRERGYEYLIFPMQWFETTRDSPLASHAYTGPPGSGFLAAERSTELWRVAQYSTLVQKVLPPNRYSGEFIVDELRELREVPARTAPTFTMAHLPIGHRPYPFGADCGPPALDVVVGSSLASVGERRALVGAVECANRLLLGAVTDLLRRSEVAPIIIIVGDHGTLTTGWPAESGIPVDSAAAERLAAFGAFYMPDGGGEAFADEVTLVNVFRKVLRHYFGADLPDASNEGFFSDGRERFRFLPVDERAVIGG